MFLSGDSGYDTDFAAIGAAYDPCDLAILENGQYSPGMGPIHMQPEQVLQAARARQQLPVHSAKFVLNRYPWDEPLQRIRQLSAQAQLPLATLLIGEVVRLGDPTQVFRPWWEGLREGVG